jgi:hypothetical protein
MVRKPSVGRAAICRFRLISVSAGEVSEPIARPDIKALCADFRYLEQTAGVAEGDLLSIGLR